MHKNQKKYFSIKFKICATMITSLIITAVFLLVCLIPGYTDLVTKTTTQGMMDYASLYGQLVDTSLESLTSTMKHSKPLLMLVDSDLLEQDDNGTSSKTQEQQESNEEQESNPPKGPGMTPSGTLNNVMEEYSDYVTCISFSDLKGNILYSIDESNVATNISDEYYFQSVISGNSYAMSDAIVTENGTEFILAFTIANSNDELSGVIIATLSSNYLSHILSADNSQTTDSDTQTISGTTIFGSPNATVYVCDADGIVLTASNSEWIGFDVNGDEDTIVSNETNSKTGYTEYKDQDDSYYMAYTHIGDGAWLFAVDIAHSEIFTSLYKMTLIIVVAGIIVLLFSTFISYGAASSIAKPIKKTTECLESLSKFELNEIDLTDVKRYNDETGDMLNSIERAVEQLKTVIISIESSSDSVYINAKKLSDISTQLQENATENSAVAEELSAGMEETASTQDRIRQDITIIQDGSSLITDRIQDSVTSCEQIISTATTLNRETKEAREITKDIYHDVKMDAANALERAKAVEKINLMTNSIMDIASQTSLLALNASIEAARAGDAGRGFAIVAEQIGVLANQSSDTVSDISSIIEEVNGAVTDITTSLEKTLHFMESQILKDYAKFIDVSNEYNDKSTDLREDMHQIADSIHSFMNTLQSMSESIKETSETLEVASDNTISLTEKNNQVASIAIDTNQMAKESTDSAEELHEIVKVFKL